MTASKIPVSVTIDTLHKVKCEKEVNCFLKSRAVYGWIPAEYDKMREELNKISALKPPPKNAPPKIVDTRTLKPFPETSAGMVGWAAKRKEFRLEKYGPDIMNKIPLPKDEDFWMD